MDTRVRKPVVHPMPEIAEFVAALPVRQVQLRTMSGVSTKRCLTGTIARAVTADVSATPSVAAKWRCLP